MFNKSFYGISLLVLFTLSCSSLGHTKMPASKSINISERLEKIKITDLEGHPLNLKDFVGKPVFLNFWATWCGPCVSEMGSIEKVSQQFKGDIVFLAVSSESPELIRSYVKKNKFSFRFAHLDVSYLDIYVVALPTTMLIDASGQLVEEEEGYRNWTSPSSLEKLNSLVKK